MDARRNSRVRLRHARELGLFVFCAVRRILWQTAGAGALTLTRRMTGGAVGTADAFIAALLRLHDIGGGGADYEKYYTYYNNICW